MRLTLTTVLDAPLEHVWELLQRPAMMEQVAAPVMTMVPADPPAFPERWEDRPYRVRLKVFCVLPAGSQVIDISRSEGPGIRRLRDRGVGTVAKVWDHTLTAEALPDGRTRYTDTLEVRAGVLTAGMWLFSQVFFRHRQRRLRAVVARGLNTSSHPRP